MLSKRVLSASTKGRKGGLATARNHDIDFLSERATKAGNSTRDTYGIGYYRYIRTLRKNKIPKEKVIQDILPGTTVIPETSADLMKAAAKAIN